MLSRFKNNSFFIHHILLLTLLSIKIHSQEINNQYSLELSPNISNQWWSQYNNYGQELSEVRFNYDSVYESEKYDFNINITVSKNKIYFGESFVKSKLLNNTYLKAGRYYRDFSGYLNENLTSGSLLISNNAEPMPKIGLLSSYKFKQSHNFDFDFGISHALFIKNDIYKTAPMLHEKFIYLNYSKNQNHYSVGLVHEAMWAGSTEIAGDFPNSYKDFFKIFISADGPLLEGQSHANALGNHLGIWDFHYQKRNNNKILDFYYQHFFEDTSGLRFENKSDGLWGIQLSNYIPNATILLEYLNTMNQDRNPPYVDENYYNHFEYLEGWSYKGFSLGNPFISHKNNNPSKVFHLGISDNGFKKYHYKVLTSRRTDISSNIKYQISVGKMMNQFLLEIFLNGEKSMSNSYSLKLSYGL